MPITLDGEEAEDFVIRIEGVLGPIESPPDYRGAIPVIFQYPEDVYQTGYIPHVAISRSAITPAMNRWQPGGYEYKVPSPIATEVAEQNPAQVSLVGGPVARRGPSHLEIKPWALPFDIQYDVHIRARRQLDVIKMLKQVGKFLWSYGQILVIDSVGEKRGYYAFTEQIANLDEVLEIGDRMLGHTFSVRVEAELDFVGPYTVKTVTGFDIGVFTKPIGVGGL